jgi:hypothetical protein
MTWFDLFAMGLFFAILLMFLQIPWVEKQLDNLEREVEKMFRKGDKKCR